MRSDFWVSILVSGQTHLVQLVRVQTCLTSIRAWVAENRSCDGGAVGPQSEKSPRARDGDARGSDSYSVSRTALERSRRGDADRLLNCPAPRSLRRVIACNGAARHESGRAHARTADDDERSPKSYSLQRGRTRPAGRTSAYVASPARQPLACATQHASRGGCGAQTAPGIRRRGPTD